MNELLTRQWPIVIKRNIFINCIAALFGIFFLTVGVLLGALGISCIGKPDGVAGVFVSFLIAIFFLWLAYRFIAEIIKTSIHFKIAADEQGICALISGKYISIPYGSITSIWAGEPGYVTMRGGNGRSLVIILKKDFPLYTNPISNYFYQLQGHKIRYSDFELGMSLEDARDLLKTYWKPTNS